MNDVLWTMLLGAVFLALLAFVTQKQIFLDAAVLVAVGFVIGCIGKVLLT